jgi:hypothetical protein
VTQAAPAYFRDSEIVHSASGANEGFTAVDRFRLLGKPLEKRRGRVDVNVVPSDPPLYVNKIYDDPLFFGSSDFTLVATEQEVIPVTVNGQTVFTTSWRPLEASGVQLFVNGVKMAYGTNYAVTGLDNRTVTYVVTGSSLPLVTTDVVEVYYILF